MQCLCLSGNALMVEVASAACAVEIPNRKLCTRVRGVAFSILNLRPRRARLTVGMVLEQQSLDVMVVSTLMANV